MSPTIQLQVPWPACKDENIGIDGNIEGQKYGNIGGNIGEISILIKPWKKWWKFIKKYGNF